MSWAIWLSYISGGTSWFPPRRNKHQFQNPIALWVLGLKAWEMAGAIFHAFGTVFFFSFCSIIDRLRMGENLISLGYDRSVRWARQMHGPLPFHRTRTPFILPLSFLLSCAMRYEVWSFNSLCDLKSARAHCPSTSRARGVWAYRCRDPSSLNRSSRYYSEARS